MDTIWTAHDASELHFLLHSAMRYRPKIRKKQIPSRIKSSFLLILKGEYLYTGAHTRFVASDHTLVVLPKGACYAYEILSTDTECMQIELDVFRCGAPSRLAETPVPIHFSADTLPVGPFEKIIGLLADKPIGYPYLASAELFRLLAHVAQHQSSPGSVAHRRVAPAAQYISQHFREKIPAETLAKLCRVSESQLRRLFRAAYGVSPLQYKINLQMESACRLLETGACQVGQIAEMLGFDSVYEFSAMFKKKTGQSPRAYAAGH